MSNNGKIIIAILLYIIARPVLVGYIFYYSNHYDVEADACNPEMLNWLIVLASYLIISIAADILGIAVAVKNENREAIIFIINFGIFKTFGMCWFIYGCTMVYKSDFEICNIYPGGASNVY